MRISSPPTPKKEKHPAPTAQHSAQWRLFAKNLLKLSHVLRVFTFRWVAPGQWDKKLFHFLLCFYFLQKETDALPVLLHIMKSQMLLKKTRS